MQLAWHLKKSWNFLRIKKNIAFVLGLFLAGLTSMPCLAEDNPPPPASSTQADYYVSKATGSDSNPGTFSSPFKTPGKALDVLQSLPNPAGKTVLIRGGNYRYRDNGENRINLIGLHGAPGNPIQIRGYPGETVMLDAFVADFNPLNGSSMPTGWGGISLNDCSHLVLENFQVQGRCITNVEVKNSDFITLRYIESFRSDKHGLFTGGSFHDLTIECCKFYENIYGSTASHGIYISGGHWDPALPPVRNITIRYVESYFNGRHGIQFNGRIENIQIDHCNLHHNILGGISCIGVRNATIEKNVIYKNNKQGVILYTYIDTSYWDPNDPVSMDHWQQTHWTTENVQIRNNTIFMDDQAWYDDEWIEYYPKYHAGIYLVDTTEILPPFKNIVISRNIIYNHSEMAINFVNPEHFTGTQGYENLIFAQGKAEAIQHQGFIPMSNLESTYPGKWHDNAWALDPHFTQLTPTQLIDRTYQEIDFSNPALNQFNDDFFPKSSSPAWDLYAGAFTGDLTTAITRLNLSKPVSILPDYGQDIAQFILGPSTSELIKSVFLLFFGYRFTALEMTHPSDGHERACFKNDDFNCLSFAILNSGSEHMEVQTFLDEATGKVTYPEVIVVTIDPQMNYTIQHNLKVVNDRVHFNLKAHSLGLLLILCEE